MNIFYAFAMLLSINNALFLLTTVAFILIIFSIIINIVYYKDFDGNKT